MARYQSNSNRHLELSLAEILLTDDSNVSIPIRASSSGNEEYNDRTRVKKEIK